MTNRPTPPPSTMTTLYVTDMDGTLLGRDSKVSARSAEIITDLSRRGALITVATARTPATVVPLLSDALTLPPAIVLTGAALWDREKECFDSLHIIPDNEREFILEICSRMKLHPFVYVVENASMLTVYHDGDTLSSVEETFYSDRANLRLKHFKLRERVPDDVSTILWYAMGRQESIFAAAEALKQKCDLSLSCYYDIFDRTIAHLEIFAPGVSKAAAVQQLRSRLSVDRVVAFGDNLNDLPMLRVADLSVAVGNAFDEVKANADVVIGPNYDDSVARFILSDFENH